MTLSALPHPGWDEFMAQFSRRWKPGEHVFVYGETGSGKTDLAFRLLNAAPYGVAFITKPRDPIFRSALTRGYRRVHAWPPRDVNAHGHSHFLLSAKPAKNMSEEISAQRELIPDAFAHIYRDGGWTVLMDETMHLSGPLGMSSQLESFAYLARSNNLTGIYCSQRPKRIPVVIPQSCKYAFVARSRREDDIQTLSELGFSRNELRTHLNNLRNVHEFLFIDPQGDMPLMVIDTHK